MAIIGGIPYFQTYPYIYIYIFHGRYRRMEVQWLPPSTKRLSARIMAAPRLRSCDSRMSVEGDGGGFSASCRSKRGERLKAGGGFLFIWFLAWKIGLLKRKDEERHGDIWRYRDVSYWFTLGIPLLGFDLFQGEQTLMSPKWGDSDLIALGKKKLAAWGTPPPCHPL